MRPSESKKRILWLHDRRRGGSYPNSRRVAERFGISERQAQRDISRLRNDFGAPLEYSPSRGGFCYSSEFSLPEAVRETDAEEGVTAIAASESDVADAAQMMIPYTAEIRVPSKLSALELGRYIVGRRRAKPSEKAEGDGGKPSGQICLCEFRNPDLFLGMLLSAGGAIRVISPDWLREKLVSGLKELLEANED